MRLFIAVNFDNETKRQIIAVQDIIKKETQNGKFTNPDNLHLTLVFLGETAEERLPEIKNAIIQVASDEETNPPVKLTFSKAGFFKRGGKELWYLGLNNQKTDGETRLKTLQQRLARELLERNFVIDKRPFNAHITLGREINTGMWPFETGSIVIQIKRISLMQSHHKQDDKKKNVLVYTELFGYDIVSSH